MFNDLHHHQTFSEFFRAGKTRERCCSGLRRQSLSVQLIVGDGGGLMNQKGRVGYASQSLRFDRLMKTTANSNASRSLGSFGKFR